MSSPDSPNQSASISVEVAVSSSIAPSTNLSNSTFNSNNKGDSCSTVPSNANNGSNKNNVTPTPTNTMPLKESTSKSGLSSPNTTATKPPATTTNSSSQQTFSSPTADSTQLSVGTHVLTHVSASAPNGNGIKNDNFAIEDAKTTTNGLVSTPQHSQSDLQQEDGANDATQSQPATSITSNLSAKKSFKSNNYSSQNVPHHQHHPHQQQHHRQNHAHHNQHDMYNLENFSKTNLYIRGLDINTTDADLFAMCSKFGSIVSTKAIFDKMTNNCKGYGFVDFETPSSAEVAVEELQKQGILVHMAKQQESDPTNLYIANLPLQMTDSELADLLNPYGPVVSTRILIHPQTKKPRGVGFARMETKEKCDEIIAQLNGKLLKGCKETLLVKFADGANKKRNHHNHFQNKSFSGGFMNDQVWRNNNEFNHSLNSSSSSNRNFHNNSGEHSRQHQMMNHNNNVSKHSHLMSGGYHVGHHSSSSQPIPSVHLNHLPHPQQHLLHQSSQQQKQQSQTQPQTQIEHAQQQPAQQQPSQQQPQQQNSQQQSQQKQQQQPPQQQPQHQNPQHQQPTPQPPPQHLQQHHQHIQHQTANHQPLTQQQQHHHGHPPQNSLRNQNPAAYNAANFPMTNSMPGGAEAPPQWMYPQAGQPYVIPPQLLPTSLHYVNLSNQMQSLQLNPPVGGYMSSQHWSVWPNVNAKHSGPNSAGGAQTGSASNYFEED